MWRLGLVAATRGNELQSFYTDSIVKIYFHAIFHAQYNFFFCRSQICIMLAFETPDYSLFVTPNIDQGLNLRFNKLAPDVTPATDNDDEGKWFVVNATSIGLRIASLELIYNGSIGTIETEVLELNRIPFLKIYNCLLM